MQGFRQRSQQGSRNFSQQCFLSRVRPSLVKVFLGFLVAFQIIGCIPNKNEKVSGTVRVKVPWISEGKYELKTITLKTVTNMVTLQGKVARLLMAPTVQGDRLVGEEPILRVMQTEDGTYVPEDYLSSQLLTLYAHFEKLAEFDEKANVPQLIKDGVQQHSIGVLIRGVDLSERSFNNAAYVGGDYKFFLFLPYISADLPLSINAGVIAHEYFHNLFDQIFIKKSGSSYPFNFDLSKTGESDFQKRNLYHSYLLRALNEGLADVWGWLYSGDVNFVRRSISLESSRGLDVTRAGTSLSRENVEETFFRDQGLESGPKYAGPVVASIYKLGTVYANRLWKAVDDGIRSGLDESLIKRQLAIGILKAVQDLQLEFVRMEATKGLEPVRILQLIQIKVPGVKINLDIN